jgi:predicted transcriptional regulator
MARKESPILTEAELRLMDILWSRGPSTVHEVMEGLPEDTPLAYSTVLTTLRILEDKGYLTHKKDGRAHVYAAAVPREQARKSALRHLLSRFFENSAEQLVHNLLKTEKLSGAEMRRLKKMIEEAQ